MAFTYRLVEEGTGYYLGGDESFPQQFILVALSMPEDMEVSEVYANMENTKWPVLLYFPKIPANENGENYNVRFIGDDYKYGNPVGLNYSNSLLSAFEVEESILYGLTYGITTLWKWVDGEDNSREQSPVVIPGTIVIYNSTCKEYLTIDVESPLRDADPVKTLDEATILKYAPWSEKTPEPESDDDNNRHGEQFKEIIRNKMDKVRNE